MLARLLGAATFALAISCGQNDDPAGAAALYARISEGGGFRSWARAPGYPARTASFTAHGAEVEIFVNRVVSDALAGPKPALTWPDGSVIVKETYDGDDRTLVAVMEKRVGKWYWAEYDGDGETLFSGEPRICLGCHDNRKTYSDWVYGFELPR